METLASIKTKIIMKTQFRLTQKQEGVHYETTLWDNRERGGWFPFLSGYGYNQVKADTNLLKLWRLRCG